MSFAKKFIHIVYEFVEAFVISASVFVVVYLFLMQPHQVKGSSMYPTFKDQEYLLTDKITYKRSDPRYGDVIVFKAPVNGNFDFIKRIIAIPGETVMVRGGHVYINGRLLIENYLASDIVTNAGQFLLEGESYVVKPGEVMAFGDNRNHSSDSRDWGPVPEQNIIGRVFFRYWPVNVVGVVANHATASN
jgi:signal peptidase I